MIGDEQLFPLFFREIDMLRVYMHLFALAPFYDNIYPFIGGIRIREIHWSYRGGNCYPDIIRIDGRVFLYLFGGYYRIPTSGK